MAPPAVAATADTGDASGKQDDEPSTGAVAAAAAAATVAAHANKGDSTSPTEPATAHDSETDATDGADQPTDGTDDADGPEDASTDAAPPVVPPPPPPLEPDDTGEFAFDAWSQPPQDEGGGRSKAWIVPAGIIAAILAAVGFLVFSGNSTTTTTTIAALSTTTGSETATTTATSVTTTTQLTTTTVIAYPQPEDWPPTGEPIDIDDLTLKQAAIGPIDMGTPIDEVAGALVASLGEATASGIDDLCPPDESYWLAFGQLTAIFDGFDSDSVFVSYRYDEPEGTDEELGLKTLSGIAIGDTVEDLIDTYTQFTISFEIIDSKDYFRLSDGGELLLWGPVSSIDPAGLIEGIYSPTACDTAP
ncbi:MAG: hypothetical protein M3092_00340 [Actinomycetia bacterium]|nr:hypothetical protein [Actinomycetes bacterium]